MQNKTDTGKYLISVTAESELSKSNQAEKGEYMNEDEKREIERKKRIQAREMKRRQQVMKQRMILAGTAVLILLVVIVSASVSNHRKKVKQEEEIKAAQQKKAEEEAKKQEADSELHFIAVGDNILQDALLEAGKENEETWNYDALYAQVAGDIQAADLAAVNQETPLVNDHKDVSGSGLMGTPLEVGDALAKAGFDIVTQATNHAFDKGKPGILNSAAFWQTQHADVQLLGIHGDEADAENRVKVIDKKNMKIAVMNYTYGVDEDAGFSEADSYMIDVYSEDKVKADVQKAKGEADFVMVFLHAGAEYSEEFSDTARQRIDFLAAQGVDAVICSNPHVLQSYGMMPRQDGKNMLVYSSLGNFVSADVQVRGLVGGMADITLKKDGKTGEVSVSDYKLVPLVMHYDSEKKNCAVYKVSDYTEELAKAHGIHQETDETFTLDSIKELAAKYESPQAFSPSGDTGSDGAETEVKGKGLTDTETENADSKTENTDNSKENTDNNKENTDNKKENTDKNDSTSGD